MAMLTLAAFSAAAGILILWVFKVCSNQRALKAARRRLRANLLAMRLFGDDPLMILRSQARLLAWNARYMALLLPPFLVISIPLYFAWDHLDAVWGRAPLPPGAATILTATLRGDMPGAQLIAPAWLSVESPPVRVPAEHAVCWRVRVLQQGSGEAQVLIGTERAGKWVEARPGLHYLAERKAQAAGPIQFVELRYPRANLDLLGISANWVVWFCLISTLAALALRRRLRVTF